MTDKHLMIVPEDHKPTYLEEVARTNAIADQAERETQQRALAQRVNEDILRCAQCWIALWAELKELNGIALAGQGRALQNAMQGRRGLLYAYLKTFEDSLINLGSALRGSPDAQDYDEALHQAERFIEQVDAAIVQVLQNAARGREQLTKVMAKFSSLPTPAGISYAGRRRDDMDNLIYARAARLVKAMGNRWREIAQKLCDEVKQKQHAGLPLDDIDQAIIKTWIDTPKSNKARGDNLRDIFKYRQRFR